MDRITQYNRALDYRNKAQRAYGRYVVMSIEAGMIPDTRMVDGFDVLTVISLAPVSIKRRMAAFKAYRAKHPAPMYLDDPPMI